MYYKIFFLLKTTAVLILAVVFETRAQSTSIGARFTTNLYRAAFVENPSASNIYGTRNSSIEIGVYGLKYFKNEKWGVKMGVELGLIPWSLGIEGPRNAFGTGQGGAEQLGFNLGGNDLSYKALTLSATYKIPLKNRFIEISAGSSIRDYAFGNAVEEKWMGLNRSIPYDRDDPSQGPPDVYSRMEPLDNYFHISFPVAVDYIIRTGKKTQLKFGIMNNIAVKPISESKLTVIMYGDTYNGKFSPRTSFWGANIILDYSLNKIDHTYNRTISSKDQVGKLRKSIFIENHGSGVRFSANFDTRLKKDVNNGFGIKAGIGRGLNYKTDVRYNNKPNDRSYITLPMGINYIMGNKSHGIEAGIGITPQIALTRVDKKSSYYKSIYVPYYIGYRYQPNKEGLLVRAAWTPFHKRSDMSTNFGFIYNNTAISIGYSFR